jgi:hypothetical protein
MEGGGEREGGGSEEREEMGRAKQSKTNMVACTLPPFTSTYVYTSIIHICTSTIQINSCLHINLCATYSHSSSTIGHHTSGILLPTIHVNSCLHSHYSCLHSHHSHQYMSALPSFMSTHICTSTIHINSHSKVTNSSITITLGNYPTNHSQIY